MQKVTAQGYLKLKIPLLAKKNTSLIGDVQHNCEPGYPPLREKEYIIINVTVPEERNATAKCTKGMREILNKHDNNSTWRY